MESLKNKKHKAVKLNTGAKLDFNGRPNYYFHADEDFREDWDWGKIKTPAVKTVK